MTAAIRGRTVRERAADLAAVVETRHVVRAGALAAALVLVASFSLVLRDIVATVGDPTTLTLVVLGSLLAATVLWPVVSVRGALAVGAVAFVGGLLAYAVSLPFEVPLSVAFWGTIELLTGRSVLWIVQAELWALFVAPAPVFVTWVLALKRQYVRAAMVGGAMLCFLVLSGDATLTVTILGVVAAAALVGIGDIERRGNSLVTVEYLAVALGIMVVAPFVFSVVPGGAAGPLGLVGSDTPTMEENVVDSGSNLEIVGSIDQDPEVRFVVEGEEPRYWRTGSYDRYTGDGWVQSGESEPYDERLLERPDGLSETVTYEIEAQSAMASLPAPWRPVEVEGAITDQSSIAPDGMPTPEATLQPGDDYTVTSGIPTASPNLLAEAGTDYPDEIEDRYTQIPETTPDRVAERTGEITAEADNPYEKAVVVEEWLRTNRDYSLDVDRPDGDIVDAFLFEMEAGYCTYYATAMVGMLRTADIPTRLAVGYTPGEPAGEDEWVVRGTNSHAWVEVYFPEHGWVQFDPTPADPRVEAEAGAIADAGPEADIDGLDLDVGLDRDTEEDTDDEETTDDADDDTSGSGSLPTIDELDPDDGPDQQPDDPGNDTDPGDGNMSDPADDGGTGGAGESDDGVLVSPGEIDTELGDSGPPFELPASEQVLLSAIVLAGLAVGIRRSRVPDVVGREVRLRFQRRTDPETDIERAHDRMLLVLEKRHRPREPGETVRQYIAEVDADPAARRLATIRERARYAGEYSKAAADEAVDLVERVRAA